MNAEEEKRLCIVVQQAVVAALNALFKESPGDTLGEVTAEGLDKTDDLYVKEMDLRQHVGKVDGRDRMENKERVMNLFVSL